MDRCRECGRPDVMAKGYCSKHYQQILNHGKILIHKEKGYWVGKKCLAPWCESKDIRAKGFCDKHYRQMVKYERLIPDEELAQKAKCSVSLCSSDAVGHGYCSRHYKQFKKHGKIKKTHRSPKICTIYGCQDDCYSRGLCKKHYAKLRRDVVDGSKTWRDVHLQIIDENNKKITEKKKEYDDRRRQIEALINLEIMTEIMADEPIEEEDYL